MAIKLPTLDIVIPCYNEADTIGACLDALLAQGADVSNVIVVDNNSTDETPTVVKSYAKKHAAIRLVTEQRQGVQFARNTGFDKAKSDIIGRIDADTVLGKGWAAEVRRYYATNPEVAAASGHSGYYDLPFAKLTDFLTDLFAHAANRKLADSHTMYGANMTLRRDTWREIRGEVCMRNGIMEDQDLGYHVTAHGNRTGYIKHAEASVSGRRMRMSPLRYWRYNKQWWMTYANHGERLAAAKIRVAAWAGNFLQAFGWLGLQFYDPARNRFSLRYLFAKKDERSIP